jgi:hypothetical protein
MQPAVRARLVAEGRKMAAEATADRSLYVLLAANLAALAIAYATGMTLRQLMLVYWIQSVVIGATTFIRIVSLERFDTSGFRMNDQPVEETPAGKYKVAAFFALHYGVFHVAYFAFIVFGSRGALGPAAGYLLCALVFLANHGYSLLHNARRDAAGRPNIGILMFLPYARIVPMHLTIILGAYIFGGPVFFFLFGLLKTAADVVMHTVEHRVLNKDRSLE